MRISTIFERAERGSKPLLDGVNHLLCVDKPLQLIATQKLGPPQPNRRAGRRRTLDTFPNSVS